MKDDAIRFEAVVMLMTVIKESLLVLVVGAFGINLFFNHDVISGVGVLLLCLVIITFVIVRVGEEMPYRNRLLMFFGGVSILSCCAMAYLSMDGKSLMSDVSMQMFASFTIAGMYLCGVLLHICFRDTRVRKTNIILRHSDKLIMLILAALAYMFSFVVL